MAPVRLHHLDLLGRHRQRLRMRRRIAHRRILHRHGAEGARLQVDPALSLGGQVRPASLHLRDRRVRILWRLPRLVRRHFLSCRDRSNRANSARVGGAIPEASAKRRTNGIVKLRLAAVSDAQRGWFATGWSPVSWGSIDEFFVNLTMPLLSAAYPVRSVSGRPPSPRSGPPPAPDATRDGVGGFVRRGGGVGRDDGIARRGPVVGLAGRGDAAARCGRGRADTTSAPRASAPERVQGIEGSASVDAHDFYYPRSTATVSARTASELGIKKGFCRLKGYTGTLMLVVALRARDRQLGLVTAQDKRQIA